jgi:hypothetical protein
VRIVPPWFLVFLVVTPVTLSAQSDVLQRQSATEQPDGGVSQVLQSIVISPMPNAPFTTMLRTEWVRYMSDGGTISLVNERRIARDRQGRIYQERWFLVPKYGKVKSQMSAIQIADSRQHKLLTCMMDRRHICDVTPYTDSASAVREERRTTTVALPHGDGFTTREDLGNNSMEGLDVVGTKISTTINPGVIGNDNAFTIEREFWYSPQLGINLLSRVKDPRFGIQTFTITNLSLTEPDPQLFTVPKGFQVVDVRGQQGTK